MRVVEEDRRLLMQASGGCFRFVVDVERLSTIEGRRKTDKGGRVYTGSGPRGRAFRRECKHDTHVMILVVKGISGDNLFKHT